jgi:cytidine deaminase
MTFTKREFMTHMAALVSLTGVSPLLWQTSAHAREENMVVPVLRKADTLSSAEIFAWLKQLRGHPYVAQSGFDVTSVFKLRAAGEIYYAAGVNVENRDFTMGTCGEEGAIAAAICAFGEQIDIVEGWVMGAPNGAETSDIACYPCGECRQRIAQYAAPETPIHVVALDGSIKDTKTRAELLPHAFSFRDLQHTALHEQQSNANTPVQLFETDGKILNNSEIFNWLGQLRGDVRVSDYNETAVWRLQNGAYIAGVNIENAAYPSSTNVSSVVAALMHAHFGGQYVQEIWMHGFYNNAEKNANRANAYYAPSGASLQVLQQFAQHPTIKLHCFNGQGETKTQPLAEILQQVPKFA